MVAFFHQRLRGQPCNSFIVHLGSAGGGPRRAPAGGASRRRLAGESEGADDNHYTRSTHAQEPFAAVVSRRGDRDAGRRADGSRGEQRRDRRTRGHRPGGLDPRLSKPNGCRGGPLRRACRATQVRGFRGPPLPRRMKGGLWRSQIRLGLDGVVESGSAQFTVRVRARCTLSALSGGRAQACHSRETDQSLHPASSRAPCIQD